MFKPENFLLQYIVEKYKKPFMTSQDMNELYQAGLRMGKEIALALESEGPDYSLEKEFTIFTKIRDRLKYRYQKIGIFISFVHPDEKNLIAIGYSLCNTKKMDEFDKILSRGKDGLLAYRDYPNLGLKIATGRAIRWAVGNERYVVPVSIHKQFLNFAERSNRYYKEQILPQWVQNFILSY